MAEKGILLINTGSPASLNKKSVKKFIGDMLSDPYVMGMPFWFRVFLAKGIIAPLRASASYKRYQIIWGNREKSPLHFRTLLLAEQIEKQTNLPTTIVMRYGNPQLKEAMDLLIRKVGLPKELVLLPLFPQYASSSYQSAVEQIKKQADILNLTCNWQTVKPYYNHSAYIQALAEHIQKNLKGEFDSLIFTYHSLPLTHIEVGKRKGISYDYEYQCRETTNLVANALNIPPEKYFLTYTSPFGKKWIKPFLNEVVAELPLKGHQKIAVVSPGFIIDNLETLYDIDVVARKIFLDKGGQQFTYIPCLNELFDKIAPALVQ